MSFRSFKVLFADLGLSFGFFVRFNQLFRLLKKSIPQVVTGLGSNRSISGRSNIDRICRRRNGQIGIVEFTEGKIRYEGVTDTSRTNIDRWSIW